MQFGDSGGNWNDEGRGRNCRGFSGVPGADRVARGNFSIITIAIVRPALYNPIRMHGIEGQTLPRNPSGWIRNSGTGSFPRIGSLDMQGSKASIGSPSGQDVLEGPISSTEHDGRGGSSLDDGLITGTTADQPDRNSPNLMRFFVFHRRASIAPFVLQNARRGGHRGSETRRNPWVLISL